MAKPKSRLKPKPKPRPKPKPASRAISKERLLAKNREEQKAEARKARDKVRDVISGKDKEASNEAGFIQGLISEILEIPVEEAGKEWGAARRAFRESTEGKTDISLGEYMKRLTKATNPSEEKMKQAALIAVAYIEEITEGGEITPEDIMRMRDSASTKASQLAKLLLMKKNENLLAALKWSLGMVSAKGRSVSDGKKPALETLTNHLDGDPSYKKKTTTFVWMIITFMSSRDRVAFAKNYIAAKPLNPADATKFIEAGNKNGVFSLEEMEEILGPKLFDAKKKEEYVKNWKQQNDFAEAARYIVMPTYGSENKMGEMFTFKNILVHFLAPLWAGLTLAGNTLVPFASGGWKKPGETLKKVFKNHNNWAAASVLTAVHLSKKGKSIGDVLKGSEEEDKRKARKDLYTGTRTNPEWGKFFVGDNYTGAGVFWEYIQDSRRGNKKELDPDQLKLDEFVKWLDFKAKKDTRKAKYAKLREKFEGSEEKGYKISGRKTRDYELARFAQAFYVLKIGGEQTETNYAKAINTAKGGTPPKTA